ncbi:MAG: hypothetical protein M3O61_16320, partial [Gemmatimonadota bacterium]|nr:hypothetical protein [Gemmatimonadota bacterium]
MPAERIARNVLEELGVPSDRSDAVFELIISSARECGFLREVKGQLYVDLHADGDPQDADDGLT